MKRQIKDLRERCQFLERHIDRLEKLLDQRQQSVTIERIVGEPIREQVSTWPFRPVPVRCTDGCDVPPDHGATIPATCRRCGWPPLLFPTITTIAANDLGGSRA